MTSPRIIPIAAVMAIALSVAPLEAQPSAFTYQGQLTNNGTPAAGNYDIQFELFNDATAAPDGTTVFSFGVSNATNVAVTDGIFTTQVDFGFTPWSQGQNSYFLEVAVKEAGSADPFTTLLPRQPVTSAPLASFAAAVNASSIVGQVTDANLSSVLTAPRTFSSPGNTFFGDGSNLTGLDATQLTGVIPTTSLPPIPTNALANAWQIGGNSGTSAGTDFIGTTDPQPLDFRTNNARALRLETSGGSLVSVIGGHESNSAGSALATIGGGGSPGAPNTINGSANGSTISGGVANTINNGSAETAIGGGSGNQILENSLHAVIGGGRLNVISDDADNSTIGGGLGNAIAENAPSSSIGGGVDNTINQTASGATIAGGTTNTIAANAFHAAIGGGSGNVAGGLDGGFPAGIGAVVAGGQNNQAIGHRAVVSGGLANTAIEAGATVGGGSDNDATGVLATIGGGTDNTAAGIFSTVPGGELNEAFLPHSFAAGFRAKALNPGAFVWSDNLNASDFSSTADGQFAVRAGGGAYFETGGTGLSIDSSDFYISGNATAGRFGNAVGNDFNPTPENGLIIEQGLNESSGIHFDGDSVTIWSPGDNDRLVRFIDEDTMLEEAYIDGDGGIFSAEDITANRDLIAGRSLIATEGLTFTEEGIADTARITFFDQFKYIEASEENGAIRFQAGMFGFNRFPSISGNAATLQLDGSASKTTAGSWLAHSDSRIKKEVETIGGKDALKALGKVRPVSFRYTDSYVAQHPCIEDHDYVNVIAQEFAEVFPDWVSDSGEELPGEEGTLLQVDTYPLTLYSVAAIKELEQQVKSQSRTITSLEATNEQLEARLKRLEQLIGGPTETVSN